MGHYATFHVCDKVSPEEVARFRFYRHYISYVGCSPDSARTYEVEKAFSESFRPRLANTISETCAEKRSCDDWAWMDIQVVTPQIVEAVRVICGVVGYGKDQLDKLLAEHIGWTVWVTID